MTVDTTGGSGPYKASGGAIASFTRHTVFQPKMLPVGQKLPVILWGNGACSGNGQWFSKFLTEIASHGFVVIANGDPNGSLLSGTTAKDIPDAIEWVYQNAGTGNWTHLDKTRLAAAGQSCGGIQAYSASVDPRIKLTGIFNSGLIIAENQKYFDRLHAPVGYFLGGESDIAYLNGERDYKTLPAKIPTVKANLPVGHMATYGDQYGGKFGKAAVAFFKWQLKGDTAAGELFLNPATSSLTKDGWAIESKNWKRP
ncbi:hypothetical protein EJ06DRAFT_540240 [Trichodelitschia bisporula]|uniref:Alpha/beta-hydrolase n=1 Tax=Trichodelitschia bisporula TaxID=703511 RepID=A0A6G1HIN7_9PEZI|nr:hypothetical protein EJ06DRAFT_540240 [Trichodelitschia bisporula]